MAVGLAFGLACGILFGMAGPGGIVDRADAAIAIVEGRHDDARLAIDAARLALMGTADQGGAAWSGDQLDWLEAQLPA